MIFCHYRGMKQKSIGMDIANDFRQAKKEKSDRQRDGYEQT